MSIDLLRGYVNATGDDEFLAACWAEAEALVVRYIGASALPPERIVTRATLEVGAELFHRRQAPGGITQFATVDGPSPVRLARDPMLAAYPILDPFLPGGFA